MADESVEYSRPAWLPLLPRTHQETLREVYEALEQNRLRLIPGGLRTLIELTVREVLGESQPLPRLLWKLRAAELIGGKDRALLEDVVAVANASLHDGEQLSRGAVLHMVMCVERLLQSVFVLQPHPELQEVTTRRAARRKRP